MKKLITLLYLVPFMSFAQSWCPPGATWKFDTGSPWGVFHTLNEYTGDTVIDGYVAQRIENSGRITDLWGIDTLIVTHGPDYFTRNNGDVVWEYNGTGWDTLYWFSALPGDHWSTIHSPGGGVCPDGKWVVVDTSTTVVGGIPLRTLDLVGYEETWVSIQGATIMERFGGEHEAIFPGQTLCGGILECFCTLMCYRDQDINANTNCQITLNVNGPLGTTGDLNIVPQPASEKVWISSTNGAPLMQVILYDVGGKVVLNKAPNSTERFELDVSQLPAGYYVLHTLEVHGAVRTAPLVVAR